MTGFENIKAKDDYVLSYNRRLRIANWVCEVCGKLCFSLTGYVICNNQNFFKTSQTVFYFLTSVVPADCERHQW